MKPIIFNTDMVRAILNGRKTQTRRVIKLPERLTGRPVYRPLGLMYAGGIKRPTYQPGDILWVRETWQNICAAPAQYAYKADGEFEPYSPWKPSIHMPREAARLFLKITGIRAERLQEISHDDAVAEGTIEWICEEHKSGSHIDNAMRGAACAKPERAFALLWDSIYAKRGYPWNSNPWVWVIEFERSDISA